jgi:hypothetical protein
MRVIIFLFALAIGSSAQAATILIKPAANVNWPSLMIDGDLEANDGDQFRSKISFLSKAIVAFRSDGGSVVAGILIGERGGPLTPGEKSHRKIPWSFRRHWQAAGHSALHCRRYGLRRGSRA